MCLGISGKVVEIRRDITACYLPGANCYVTKPMLHSEFAKLIKALEDFWVLTAKPPL